MFRLHNDNRQDETLVMYKKLYNSLIKNKETEKVEEKETEKVEEKPLETSPKKLRKCKVFL